MEEQKISFETAKLAKEAGWNGDMYDREYNPVPHKIYTTQSLLQKWLRDEKKLMIGMVYYAMNNGYWEWRVHYKPFFGSEPSYEEALEIALKRCLILLKQQK